MLIISKESAILKIRTPTRQRNQRLLTEPGNLVVFTIKKPGFRINQSPASLIILLLLSGYLFYSDIFRYAEGESPVLSLNTRAEWPL